MWVRLRESSSICKRFSSRDADSSDVEENSSKCANLLHYNMGQENTHPCWKHSFPHVIAATFVSFLFGYHIGVVNEPLESISIDLGFSSNTLAEGLVVSICLAGAFFGSLLSGWIADGVGRRKAFQLCALPLIIGASISAMADNLPSMLVGRLLVGIGLGVGPPVASLYIAEVSPAFVRGTYGSFIQIATCFGLIAALLIGIPVKRVDGWWRLCFWLSTIPAVILILSMIFCAESPYWLYKRGRIVEAETELERLLGGSHVSSAMKELTKSDRGDDSDSIKFLDLFSGRHSRVYGYLLVHFAIVFIGSSLFALQQLSGINAVFYFSSTVFKKAGVSSNVANIFIGISNFLGSVIALSLMDKLGRKVLLLVSFSGMAMSMALQATAPGLSSSDATDLYLSVSGMLLFVLTFAIGAGPVPGLLLPEIFPSRIRAKAMAFSMSVHWVFNFLVGLLFLPLLDQLGPKVLYTIFGTFSLMAVAFVKRNVMETKGKSLQEIEIALLAVD